MGSNFECTFYLYKYLSRKQNQYQDVNVYVKNNTILGGREVEDNTLCNFLACLQNYCPFGRNVSFLI